MINGTELLSAAELAISHGHSPGPWQRNGPNLRIARCARCLCLAVVDLQQETATGVMLQYRCDSQADRSQEFKSEPMSAEHQSRVRGPWKHPAEGAK